MIRKLIRPILRPLILATNPNKLTDKIDNIRLKLATRPLTPEQDISPPGEIFCEWDYSLKDSITGEVLFQSKPRRCQSFVKNFLVIMMLAMSDSEAMQGAINIYNENRVNARTRYTFCAWTSAGDIYCGPVVGTGVGAPTITDYNMGTQIGHGTGAGQLQYSAVTFGAPASDATTSQMTITRNFANASGGSITVQEIGCMVVNNYPEGDSNSGRYLILRDLTGGIAVPNGQTLTVNYRPQVSV